MKTPEELNALKAELETVSKKLHELTEEELAEVTAGMKVAIDDEPSWWRTIVDFFFKSKN